MPDLTLVSLFDGVGGFPLALQRCGVELKVTVEIDKAAAAVSARHFPGAAQFSDVKEVSGDELRAAGFIPERGIVTAGWPCQDFSVAGRRAGLAGERSGLWWQVYRILDELRPKWFIGENVPGLLSSVCQCPGDGTCVTNGHRDTCGDKPHEVKPDGCCVGGCMESHGGAMGFVLGSLAELGYGVAYRILDAKYFGVPQQRRRVFIVGHLGAPWGAAAEVLFEPEGGEGNSAASIKAGEGTTRRTPSGTRATGIAPALVSRYAKGTNSNADDALIVSTLQGGGKRGYRIDAESAAGNHLIAFDWQSDGERCYPPVSTTHVSALSTTRQDAIAFTENQRGELVTKSTMGALKTGGGKPGQGYPAIATPSAVRRLTPLECERLQGYPDKWAEGQSDAQIYRQMGNTLAVPVVEWIGRGIVAVNARLAALA